MQVLFKSWARFVLVVPIVIAQAACERELIGPYDGQRDNPRIAPVIDVCWPISSVCEDRPLTTNEKNRITSLSMNINTAGDPRCSQIRSQAINDVSNDAVRMWTAGPEEYDPDDYYGDRHNVPGITHITANALNSNLELMRTLIHEAAHAIGVTDDGDAAQLEESCLGDYDI